MLRPPHWRTALAAAVVAALGTPALAPADTSVPLPGAPLHVHVGDRGQLQGFLDGIESGIFFSPSSTVGDAGFFLSFPYDVPNPSALDGRVYGFDGAAGPTLEADDYENSEMEPYRQIAQLPVVGDGSAANPFRQVTRYAVRPVASDLLTVDQTTSYTSGSQLIHVRWDVRNISGQPVRFKALAAADFYFEGSDRGTGVFSDGPPRFIGGTNADSGRSGGFVEVGAPAMPWSAYQAMPYGNDDNEVWGKVQRSARTAAATLDSSVVGEPVDNAGAVEWTQRLDTPLPQGQTASFETVIQVAVPAALELSPTNAASAQGTPAAVIATAKDTSGVAYAGRVLRYDIVGVNAGAGAVQIGLDGTAAIVDPAVNVGADTIVAYIDFNNNGARDPVEPQTSALMTIFDGIPPGCGVRITGDRPGGGGRGRPLRTFVTCNEAVNVTTAGTLTFRVRVRINRRLRTRTRIVPLPVTRATIPAGQEFALPLGVSRSAARTYRNKRGRADVTMTLADAAGNVSTVSSRRNVTMANVRVAKKKPKRPRR